MSSLFPEQPLLFYPSLARRLGTDEALLLGIYHQFGRHHGGVDDDGRQSFILRRREWLALADFWDEERLATVTSSLVTQGVLEAEMLTNGGLRIRLLETGEGAAADPASAPPAVAIEKVVPKPRVAPKPRISSEPLTPTAPMASQSTTQPEPPGQEWQPPVGGSDLMARGPAPSFGGSTGWRRPKDDLERLFEQQEQRNRQLHPMSPDWQPGDTAYQMLQKSNISAAFADDCVAEFVAYWLERDRKEVSWDHAFIRLVKKEWVKAQGRQAREARLSDDTTEASGERYQADSRAQRRERITDAVMDIHNTDW